MKKRHPNKKRRTLPLLYGPYPVRISQRTASRADPTRVQAPRPCRIVGMFEQELHPTKGWKWL